MPPFVPRKRQRSDSPPASSPPAKRTKRTVKPQKPRPNVFHTLDTEPQPPTKRAETEAFLRSLESDQSSLSDVDSDDFEDVLPASPVKRRKVAQNHEDDAADSDEEMEWEDAITRTDPGHVYSVHKPSGDLDLVLSLPDDAVFSRISAGGKKGPTKIERMIRVQTHCMHVQFLLWHNSIRNSWINDKEVQALLVNGLSDGIKAEVARWRTAMGYTNDSATEQPKSSTVKKGKGKAKGWGKAKENTTATSRDRIRDWGAEASRLEAGTPNLSRGDPLIRLLKYLSAYWKKRFRITAPGLRKTGYRTAAEVSEEVKSFHNDPHDAALYGERITNLEEFRILAKKWEGSRDVAAQLFTALMRALGIEARLVASLQPTGFGWTKGEEAKPRRQARNNGKRTKDAVIDTEDMPSNSDKESDAGNPPPPPTPKPAIKGSSSIKPTKSKARQSRGDTTSAPIDPDGNSSSELSSVPDSDFDTPVVTISPAKPSSSSSKPIDKDLLYPIYWTEALSPVSNTYYPVSTSVNPNIATAPEHYAAFEPRGAAAEKAKQVLCYVVAYSLDGSAKDVTVRYLKRHQLPGKTKGFRLPIEKIPIYNKRGKVLKYENYDWFKRVMSCYVRSSKQRTPADDIEEQGDLIPFKPAPTAKDGSNPKGVETLQRYKNSAEFVLERHLRREEAILPTAKPVKFFAVGKGEKAIEEPVYRREDVVACKTVESWHKEGRQLKTGEQALKFVPYRAVTLIRIRELEDTARETGEKPTQGLYSKDQTEWIIPDPIQDGRIPKNGFGNIDVYVPSMVPVGGTHVRLKGTAKICRKLGIDYAEACTGFEFGNRRAVPVLTGVVVAEENKQLVVDAWREEERIKKEKEEGKRERRALALWKKFLHGLRVMKRIKEEYGIGDDVPDDANPFVKKQHKGMEEKEMPTPHNDDDDIGGGFLIDDGDGDGASDTGGGGFVLPGEDEDSDFGGGGFVMDHNGEEKVSNTRSRGIGVGLVDDVVPATVSASNVLPLRKNRQYPDTPISLQSAHKEITPVEKDEDSAAQNPLNSPDEDEDGEESSDDFVPAKSQRGAARGRGRRGRRISTTRPSRSAATSSPYFKKQK